MLQMRLKQISLLIVLLVFISISFVIHVWIADNKKILSHEENPKLLLPVSRHSNLDYIENCSFVGKFPNYDQILNLPKHNSSYMNMSLIERNVKYILIPKCSIKSSSSMEYTLLIMVKSSTSNYKRRNAIRSLWGGDLPCHVLLRFMLGFGEKEQKKILRESQTYGDIVQGDFVENYNNNTIKTALSFHYILTICQTFTLVFFIDDDFVIDLEHFLQHVGKIYRQRFIYEGYRVFEERVLRDIRSKWYIPCSSYPFEFWSPYLAGGAYLASMETVQKLYDHFHLVTYYSVDDAWLGLVAVLAKIPHSDRLYYHSGGKYKHFAFLREMGHNITSMSIAWIDLINRTSNRKTYFDDRVRGTKE